MTVLRFNDQGMGRDLYGHVSPGQAGGRIQAQPGRGQGLRRMRPRGCAGRGLVRGATPEP